MSQIAQDSFARGFRPIALDERETPASGGGSAHATATPQEELSVASSPSLGGRVSLDRPRSIPYDDNYRDALSQAFRSRVRHSPEKNIETYGEPLATRYREEAARLLSGATHMGEVCQRIIGIACSVFPKAPPDEEAFQKIEQMEDRLENVAIFVARELAPHPSRSDNRERLFKTMFAISSSFDELRSSIACSDYKPSPLAREVFKARCEGQLRYEKKALGRGQFGSVHRTNIDGVVVKILRKHSDGGAFGESSNRKEFRRIVHLSSKNAPEGYFFIEDSEKEYIFMQGFEGLDARKTFIRSETRSDTATLLSAMIGWAEGLQHIHSRGYVMSDFKPENAMVSNGEGKVIDLGLSMAIGRTARGSTPCYADPTLTHYPEAIAWPHNDVWSFGASAFDILTKQSGRLFKLYTCVENAAARCVSREDLPRITYEILVERVQEVFDSAIARELEACCPGASKAKEREAWFALISGCLQLDPSNRLPMHGVISRLQDLQTRYAS